MSLTSTCASKSSALPSANSFALHSILAKYLEETGGVVCGSYPLWLASEKTLPCPKCIDLLVVNGDYADVERTFTILESCVDHQFNFRLPESSWHLNPRITITCEALSKKHQWSCDGADSLGTEDPSFSMKIKITILESWFFVADAELWELISESVDFTVASSTISINKEISRPALHIPHLHDIRNRVLKLTDAVHLKNTTLKRMEKFVALGFVPVESLTAKIGELGDDLSQRRTVSQNLDGVSLNISTPEAYFFNCKNCSVRLNGCAKATFISTYNTAIATAGNDDLSVVALSSILEISGRCSVFANGSTIVAGTEVEKRGIPRIQVTNSDWYPRTDFPRTR